MERDFLCPKPLNKPIFPTFTHQQHIVQNTLYNSITTHNRP